MKRIHFTVGFCLALAASAWSAPLWAEDADKVNPGMPQLNTAFFPSQIFWLTVTFTILYVLMANLALPRVKQVQDKRRAVIAANLKAAAEANEAAKRAVAEVEKILADARIQAIESEDTSRAVQQVVDLQAEQHKDLERRIHQAEVRIQVARDAAMREVHVVAAELAAAIFKKITGSELQAKS